MSIEEIADRLDDSFSLLSAGTRTGLSRHRTLRATMDWSYQLLPAAEQLLLQELSVFAGGFSIDAVEAICPSKDSQQTVLELMAHLVDKSLVRPRQIAGHSRYRRLLEIVSQYANEKLSESGRRLDLVERHARYFLAVVENVTGSGGPPMAWMNTLEIEQGNLRAALSWSLRNANDPTIGVRLAAALWPFWAGRGDLREGRAWLHRALRHEHFTDAPPATRAAVLNGAGMLAMAQDDAAEAKDLIEQGLELYRDLDTEGIAASLVNLGSVAWLGERSDIPIVAIIAEAVSLKPELTDPSTLAMVLTLEGGMALAAGQPDKMAELNLESLSLFRHLDDARGTAMTLMNVGLARLADGDINEAETRLREALEVAHSISHNLFVQYVIIGLAGVAVARGRPERATRLWAAADALGDRYGTKFTPAGRTMIKYDESVAAVRTQLGTSAWNRERAAGDAMSLEEAVAFAMADVPMTTELFEPQHADPLSVREVDILRLVAQGLTSAGIADRLFLSTRTVDWHLSAIYRKLDVHTRSEATRFAVEHGYLSTNSTRTS